MGAICHEICVHNYAMQGNFTSSNYSLYHAYIFYRKTYLRVATKFRYVLKVEKIFCSQNLSTHCNIGFTEMHKNNFLTSRNIMATIEAAYIPWYGHNPQIHFHLIYVLCIFGDIIMYNIKCLLLVFQWFFSTFKIR